MMLCDVMQCNVPKNGVLRFLLSRLGFDLRAHLRPLVMNFLLYAKGGFAVSTETLHNICFHFMSCHASMSFLLLALSI